MFLAVGCKKEAPSGMPPAAEWKEPAKPAPAGSARPHPGLDVGSSAAPHVAMQPQKTAPKALEQLPDGRVGLGPFSLVAPKEWTVKPVTSSMRAAHFVLSDKAGEEAELIVYFFDAGGAGSIEANLDRWVGQFQQADGKPSKDVAKVEKLELAGQDATLVSVTGRYVAAAMPGGSEMVDKQGQAMLAAIVASPSGPYYFKLVGAKATVTANTARFRAMLSSIKLK